mmetsp:Transcript_35080/g.34103  ORF Transcript_35080/g.34103 Transcript_35080/m.34103 type:complete len:252 (-) Transcript_35080:2878-3633(-)
MVVFELGSTVASSVLIPALELLFLFPLALEADLLNLQHWLGDLHLQVRVVQVRSLRVIDRVLVPILTDLVAASPDPEAAVGLHCIFLVLYLLGYPERVLGKVLQRLLLRFLGVGESVPLVGEGLLGLAFLHEGHVESGNFLVLPEEVGVPLLGHLLEERLLILKGHCLRVPLVPKEAWLGLDHRLLLESALGVEVSGVRPPRAVEPEPAVGLQRRGRLIPIHLLLLHLLELLQDHLPGRPHHVLREKMLQL